MKTHWILTIALLAGLIVSVTACSKTIMQKPAAVEQEPEPVAQVEPVTTAPEPQPIPQVETVDETGKAQARFLYDHVYFDFDSAALRPDNKALLALKAQWLNDNADVIAVLIEGHCDERGTEAYNLALGARRAQVVKAYLVGLGISSGKLATKSLGEERPLDQQHNEEAWAKNRRVSFVIN